MPPHAQERSSRVSLPDPFQTKVERLIQRNRRLPAEHRPCLLDGGYAQAHVVPVDGHMVELEGIARYIEPLALARIEDHLGQLLHGRRSRVSQVERLAAGARVVEVGRYGRGHVVYPGEAPDLLAVAEDRQWVLLLHQQAPNEVGKDMGYPLL